MWTRKDCRFHMHMHTYERPGVYECLGFADVDALRHCIHAPMSRHVEHACMDHILAELHVWSVCALVV